MKMAHLVAQETRTMQAQFDSMPPTSKPIDIGFDSLPHLTDLMCETHWKNQHSADFLVTSNDVIEIRFVYPFSKPIYTEFRNKKKGRGFTRDRIIKLIVLSYLRFYKQEKNTSTLLIIPRAKRSQSLNRAETDGTYGIFGHDMEDLVLEALYFDETSHVVSMFIGS